MSAYLQDAKADGLGLSRGAAVCIEGHHEELIEISFPHLDVPNAFVLARDLRKHPRGNYKGCVIKGYKQGRNAEIEIRKMQQSNELCIKKAPFTRLVKDVVKDVIWFMNAQAGPGQHHEVPAVSAEAITALQVSAEALLVELLRSYNQMAQHANRSTITTRDLVATRNFCSDLSHHLLEVLHGDDRQRFLQVIGMASQQYGRGDWIRARDACLDIPTGTRGRVSHVRGDLLHVLFEGSAETVALEPWMVEADSGGKKKSDEGADKKVNCHCPRQFFRFSVGGLHDVSEIRGHRRTYVGAMPGKIIQALKIKQVSNPVILVDEVDKLGRDFRGDPSSALLEVLDPEQNSAFRDLYLDVPIDLSKVLFICTANVTDTIPGPLLDRMEVIKLAGYVYEEKLAIANQYLIPQTIATNGVPEDLMELQPEALAELIRDYARESGVRELRKLLEKITRKVALSLVRVEQEARERSIISTENLRKFVGQPPHSSERLFIHTPSGVAMGLAWTALGGQTLFVEARGRVPESTDSMAEDSPSLDVTAAADSTSDTPSSSSKSPRPQNAGPRMKVTGKLGKVMGESSEIALTYARIFLRELEPKNEFLDHAHIHMNMPEGAIPKDGPSAGVTMTSALLSMALDRPVKHDMAMTGEVTLTGKVLRVGGIKEKTLAARRENVDRLVFPMSNQADYLELKPYLRAGLTAHFVDHYDDVYRLAFEDAGAPMPGGSRGSEVVTVVTPLEEAQLPIFMTGASGESATTSAQVQ
ncbi:Lon protease-like, mitochondrial [Symbiodinium microadriaticum]|uniref:Lon protease-like, mitochondrial n=1 Tax=Symbiodinium microadriaticum TaxID=2951 RepID=A0A1Q9EHC6_SYMMI|nr:Lon protease-like, mitochondrial [Symbiodinium microadriaticum]